MHSGFWGLRAWALTRLPPTELLGSGSCRASAAPSFWDSEAASGGPGLGNGEPLAGAATGTDRSCRGLRVRVAAPRRRPRGPQPGPGSSSPQLEDAEDAQVEFIGLLRSRWQFLSLSSPCKP
jgi:hypothetical protein